MKMLFVCGVNDANEIRPDFNKQGKLIFRFNGTSNVYRFLGLQESEIGTVILMGANTGQPPLTLQSRPSLVFNEISDPDSHRGALMRCIQLCDQLQAPVINHPKKILLNTRDHVARVLQNIPNVVVPRTIRFSPSGPDTVYTEIEQAALKLPVILRVAGIHGGKSSILIRGKEDYPRLHVYPFDGREFYLTEFVDYKDKDGLYTKTRIAVVGGVPLIRHHLTDSDWMVHRSSRSFMQNHPELIDREKHLFKTFHRELAPRIQPAITEITRRLGLEYYGIDCHLNDQNEILIFEANANMNILIKTDPNAEKQVNRIRSHLKKLLNSARS